MTSTTAVQPPGPPGSPLPGPSARADRGRPAGTASLPGALAMPAALALAVALSAIPWLRAYQVTGAAAWIEVAAVVSVAITAVVAGWLARPPVVSYASSLLGLAVLAVVLSGGHLTDLWHSVTQGPTRLLTETLPLGGSPSVLAGPVVVTWLWGSATAELVVRARHSAAGLAVPAVGFTLAYAATSSAPGRDDLNGPLLLGALALAALVRHRVVQGHRGVVDVTPDRAGVGAAPPSWRDGRPPAGTAGARRGGRGYAPGWRSVGAGAGLAGLLTAALAVAAPALPGMGARPASLGRPAPQTAGVIVDPVDAVASLRDDRPHAPAVPLFTVQTDRPSPGYFGIATLDDYDGGTWTFDSTFHPTGGRVPPAPAGSPGAGGQLSLATSAVTQRFTIDKDYDLPFVATLDRPTEIHGLAVDADPSSAMVIPADADTVPTSYTAVSQAPGVTLPAVAPADGIGEVRGALDPVEVADTAIPGGTAVDIAAATRFLATLTGKRPAPTVAFLQAAAAALRAKERRVDPADTPAGAAGTAATNDAATNNGGTSLAEVINAVAVVKAATPEQFATLFVMVARYLGVPARLVTGFRVPAVTGAGPGMIDAGSHQITNRDGWTWAEIPVAGIGWVVADPTPAVTTAATAPPPEAVQATPTTLPPHQANAVPQNQITGGHAIAKPSHIAVAGPRHHSALPERILAAVAALLLLLASVPALAVLRRRLRRRLRRAVDPAALAVGAWLELLDGLSRAGMPTPAGATTSEVATSAGQHFGGAFVEPIRRVGEVADQAVFSLAWPPERDSSQEAWTVGTKLRRDVLATLDRRQRLRALLSVGHTARRPWHSPASAPAPGPRPRGRGRRPGRRTMI